MKKTLKSLCFLVLLVSPHLLAQGPPCSPCAGVLTTDPAALAAALDTEPRLEEEARLYVAWDVELESPLPSAALKQVEASGAVPWLRLVFRTPSPVLENVDRLAEELSGAAELARGTVEGTHFQILWRPQEGDFDVVEYAYLLKRASVSVVGARSGARVLTAPLVADPELLRAFYGEDVAAYLDGLALAPATSAQIRDAAVTATELDPGRPLILDAAPWPKDPWQVLADAARNKADGVGLTFFQAGNPPTTPADVTPLKLLAREFQGDLSLDPYSVPKGGAEAWSFVRGEDLSLRVIVRKDPASEELDLFFPDPQLKRPARIDGTTGVAFDLFGQSRTDDGLRVAIPDPEPVSLLRLERMTASEIEGLEGVEERLTVADQRQIPVEEILRRLQAFEDAQNRRIQTYRALNTTHLRFQLSNGVRGLEVTFEGDFFFRQDEGFDWAWQTVYLNGVRWRGKKIPNIPLVQPEKAAALPLTINFTKEYTYRLRGTEEIDGRDCWVVDFSPAVAVESGRTLFRGTVWVDREHFGRVRTKALQLGLEGEVLSNEETAYFTPVSPTGETGDWTPESLWLPTRVVGQQLWNVLNATTVVERESRLTAFDINSEDFETQRATVLASDATMVRDTEKGLRYLVPDKETGQRVVDDGVRPSQLFVLGGVFWDQSLDFPLPLAGIDFFSFDFRESGKQVNLFFAGALAIGNVADPAIFDSKWDAGANLFAFIINTSDSTFRDGVEVLEEEVDSRSASLGLFLGRPLGSFGKLDLTYGLERTDFSRASDTAEDFVLPRDHLTHSLQVEASYDRAGYRLLAQGSRNFRSDWQAWGRPGSPELDAFDPKTEEYSLWSASAAKTWWLPKFQRFGLQLEYLGGENLDRFSKYGFGFFSDTRVHGYQGDSVRAERVYASHLSYGFEVGELLRLRGIVDVALATDQASGLEDEVLAGVGIEGNFIGPWDTIVNLDLGLAVDGPDDGVAVFLTLLKLFR